jgi:ketosteroid isomerase-like protein
MKKPTIRKGGFMSIIFIPIFLTSFTMHDIPISKNKKTVSEYIDGFNASDHSKILSCLTDDIIWDMPGVYHHSGKAEFDKEIENDAFAGKPIINITRLVEESDVVVAEGTVRCKKKDGSRFKAVFCDVFLMNKGKIKKLTSYLMVKND